MARWYLRDAAFLTKLLPLYLDYTNLLTSYAESVATDLTPSSVVECPKTMIRRTDVQTDRFSFQYIQVSVTFPVVVYGVLMKYCTI